MGKQFKVYLGSGDLYRCSLCRNDLALHDELVSKAFQGRHGRAFLFNHVINVSFGPSEDRQLTTGRHTVCDVFCTGCDSNLGWFYEHAYEQSQMYKVGKFILEKHFMLRERVE